MAAMSLLLLLGLFSLVVRAQGPTQVTPPSQLPAVAFAAEQPSETIMATVHLPRANLFLTATATGIVAIDGSEGDLQWTRNHTICSGAENITTILPSPDETLIIAVCTSSYSILTSFTGEVNHVFALNDTDYATTSTGFANFPPVLFPSDFAHRHAFVAIPIFRDYAPQAVFIDAYTGKNITTMDPFCFVQNTSIRSFSTTLWLTIVPTPAGMNSTTDQASIFVVAECTMASREIPYRYQMYRLSGDSGSAVPHAPLWSVPDPFEGALVGWRLAQMWATPASLLLVGWPSDRRRPNVTSIALADGALTLFSWKGSMDIAWNSFPTSVVPLVDDLVAIIGGAHIAVARLDRVEASVIPLWTFDANVFFPKYFQDTAAQFTGVIQIPRCANTIVAQLVQNYGSGSATGGHVKWMFFDALTGRYVDTPFIRVFVLSYPTYTNPAWLVVAPDNGVGKTECARLAVGGAFGTGLFTLDITADGTLAVTPQFVNTAFATTNLFPVMTHGRLVVAFGTLSVLNSQLATLPIATAIYVDSLSFGTSFQQAPLLVANSDSFVVVSRDTISCHLVNGDPLWYNVGVAVAQIPTADPVYRFIFGDYLVLGQWERLVFINKFTGVDAAVRDVSPSAIGMATAGECTAAGASTAVPSVWGEFIVGPIPNTTCGYYIGTDLVPHAFHLANASEGYLGFAAFGSSIVVVTTSLVVIRYDIGHGTRWMTTLPYALVNNSVSCYLLKGVLWATIDATVMAFDFNTGVRFSSPPQIAWNTYILAPLTDGTILAVSGNVFKITIYDICADRKTICVVKQVAPPGNGTQFQGASSAYVPKRNLTVLVTSTYNPNVMSGLYVYVFRGSSLINTYPAPQTLALQGDGSTTVNVVFDGWFIAIGGLNCVLDPLSGKVMFMTGLGLPIHTASTDFVSTLTSGVTYGVIGFTIPRELKRKLLRHLSSQPHGDLTLPSNTQITGKARQSINTKHDAFAHRKRGTQETEPLGHSFRAPQPLRSWEYPTLDEGWTELRTAVYTPTYVVMYGNDNYLHAFDPTARIGLWDTMAPAACKWIIANGNGNGWGVQGFEDGWIAGYCANFMFIMDTNGTQRWHRWSQSTTGTMVLINGTDHIVCEINYATNCYAPGWATVLQINTTVTGIYGAPVFVASPSPNVVVLQCASKIIAVDLPSLRVTMQVVTPVLNYFPIAVISTPEFTAFSYASGTGTPGPDQGVALFENVRPNTPLINFQVNESTFITLVAASATYVVIQTYHRIIGVNVKNATSIAWDIPIDSQYARIQLFAVESWIVMCFNNTVVNISATSGKQMWSVQLEPIPSEFDMKLDVLSVWQVTSTNGTTWTIIGSYSLLFVLDAVDGSPRTSMFGSFGGTSHAPFLLETPGTQPCLGMRTADGYQCALLTQPVAWMIAINSEESVQLTALSNNTVLVRRYNSLSCVSVADGTVRWSFPFGFTQFIQNTLPTTISIVQGNVVLLQLNATLYAISTSTGAVLSQSYLESPYGQLSAITATTSEAWAAMNPTSHIVAFTCPSTGAVWIAKVVNGIINVTAVDPGHAGVPATVLYVSDVYVVWLSGYKNQVCVFDTARMAPVPWAPVTVSIGAVMATVMNGFVYVTVQPAELWCISLANGEIAFILTDFPTPLIGAIASDNEGYVYVSTVRNSVFKIDASYSAPSSVSNRTVWVAESGIDGTPIGGMYSGAFTLLPPTSAQPEGIIIAQFGNAIAAFKLRSGSLIWERFSNSVHALSIRGDWMLGQLTNGAFGRFNVNTGATIHNIGSLGLRTAATLSDHGCYLVVAETFLIVSYDLGDDTTITLPPQTSSPQSRATLPPGWTVEPLRRAPPAVLKGLPSVDCDGRVRTLAPVLASCLQKSIATPSAGCAVMAMLVSRCAVAFSDDMSFDCQPGETYLVNTLAALGSAVPYCSSPSTCDGPASSAQFCDALKPPMNQSLAPWPVAAVTLPSIPTFTAGKSTRIFIVSQPRTALHTSALFVVACLVFGVVILRRSRRDVKL